MARRTRQKQTNEQRWILDRHVFHSTLQSICSFLTLDKRVGATRTICRICVLAYLLGNSFALDTPDAIKSASDTSRRESSHPSA